MISLDTLSLGIILALAGVGVWLLTRLLAHAPDRAALQPVLLEEPEQTQGEAVLVIQAGRITQVNNAARKLLALGKDESPNIERLAHQIRPYEAFLNVCATGVPDRMVLDGRLVECSAYRIALQPYPAVVVTLRDPALTSSLLSGFEGISEDGLQMFMELNQAMAASLDLETTILTVFENIQKVVPADRMQVGLWQPKQDDLVQYRMVEQDNGSCSLERLSVNVRAGEGYSGRLVQQRKPLLAQDLREEASQPVALSSVEALMRSYLGVPLQVGGELVGTLELASAAPGAFREEDLKLIEMFSRQAALALHNARLFVAEQQRTAELSGLTQLSQAFGSVRDPKNLFDRLVQSVLPLLQVEILGFLLYNENQRMLEGQAPFHGLPEQFLEMYRVMVPAGSPLESALMEQDVLITENAAEDAGWEALGLGALARGASLRETMLIPLSSGGRMLGYLQASNHATPNQTFSPDELRLLVIVANQAAPVIDNFTLIQQSRLRAQRAEALRRIASLASSAANLDEILKFSLNELARMLQADVAAIFLLDQNNSELCFHADSHFGQFPKLPEHLHTLRMDDAQYPFTVTGGQRPLVTGNMTAQTALIPLYQEIQAFWGIESLVAVPLLVRDVGIGELWLGSTGLHTFDKGSLQVAVTAAGQLASVVEQSRLVTQTDESLRRRVEQLTALTRISRELSTSLDLRYLLQLVYDESLLTTRANCGTIHLFDLNRPSPGGPRTRFYIGDMPSGELSLWEKQALEKGEPVNLADAAEAGYTGPHEGIASALIVPIAYHQKQAGLIVLHGAQPGQFDDTAVEISQTLAVQAAVVLGNAFQYEEQALQGEVLKRELDALGKLFEVSRAQRSDVPVETLLEAAAEAICEATPFQAVVISLYEPQTAQLRRVCARGVPDDVWCELRDHYQPWRAISSMMQPPFQIGAAYYIPADRSPAVPEDMHTVRLLPEEEKAEADSWNPDDLLLIPILGADKLPLGLISVDDPRDGRRPDWQTFEALELFTLQVAMMLCHARYAAQLETQVAELDLQAAALTQELEAARVRLPLLAARESEQAELIEILQRQAERMQSGLEVVEQAASQADTIGALRSVARELIARFDLQGALLAQKDAHGLRLLEMVGSAPAAANPEALFGQRNPLRQVLVEGTALLVADVKNTADWADNPLLQLLGARSFMAIPFALNSTSAAAVLAFGGAPLQTFTMQDRQAFARMAQQVSMGLQNLDLLNQARRSLDEMDILVDFSRKLGSLDPAELLKALLQSALQIIPAGQAGWAGLWDEKLREMRVWAVDGYPASDQLLDMRLTWHDGENAELPLPLRVFARGVPQRVLDLQFAQEYNLPPGDLMRYRAAAGGRLPVADMVIPLQSGSHTLGVLVLENFSSSESFSVEDENLAVSLAQQTALALENARLFQAAEVRAGQLQALTHVAGELTASLRSDELIAALLGQLGSVLPFDTGTLWLRQGNSLTVAAARGFEDDHAMTGISVNVEDSQLFREMAETGRPIYVPDVRVDARFPTFSEPERIAWVGIPLVAKAELVGVIAVDKVEAAFYTDEHINAAATFAGQAAVSLENARLFEESERRAIELDQRSRRLALLNRLSGDLSASLDVEHILKLTMQDLISVLGIPRAVALLLDEEDRCAVQVEVPATAANLPQMILPEQSPLFQRLQETRGIFHTSDAGQEPDLGGFYASFLAERETRAMLVVPLISGANLHGWLALLSERDERFSLSEIELARTICNQAAVAMQNARLFAETHRLTEDLERRVIERTADVTREHHNSQTLLRVTSELSASLDVKLVLSRTLGVLNESLGAEQSAVLLSQNAAKLYQAGKNLTESKSGRAVLQTIARDVLRKRAPVLLGDISREAHYAQPDEPDFRSVLAVPLTLGEDLLGSLLLFHSQPDCFNEGQVQLVEAAARQIGIAINNADLFNLIRDQAENLGGMLREQQVEASRSRAILEAVADGVLVTDAENTINLFNASAGRVLKLEARQVLGKSLESFSGLFGKAASDWIQTIRAWSDNPAVYSEGEIYAERLELDQGQVVEVHLAPVILRSEFLGTVSIFRDITHEVRVDRLKSEFVANVSHELRTPLTSIKGYVDVMLMGAAGELDPRMEHFLRIVRGNTERLGILVNDLLDVEKLDGGRAIFNFQAVDLRQISEEVIQDARQRAQEEKRLMQFALEMPNQLPAAHGDVERVRQILGSLVSNGYNYTPDNGKVIVCAAVNGGEIQVDVVDNGIGIPPEDQPRLFERFYRGEDPLVLASAGTGLGLAIARTLVEMHGGRIWFASSGVRGEGSVFSFTLPVHDGAAEAVRGDFLTEAGSA